MQEAGESNVHPITKKMGGIKVNARHANRDLFRFILCPVDIVYCECPVLTEPLGEKVELCKLGMFDPHELLDYLWKNDHIKVSMAEIQILCTPLVARCFCLVYMVQLIC